MDQAKKKRIALVGGLVALALVALAVLGLALANTGLAGPIIPLSPLDEALKTDWKPKAPEIFYSPLSGLEQSPEAYLRRPLVVKVENAPEARPQSGMDKADIVYEEPMEGYAVTRFALIYQSRGADPIGPVRSARRSDSQIVPQYQGFLAYSGAHDRVVRTLDWAGVSHASELANETAFYRVGFRRAPHNLYSNTSLLWGLVKRKGEYKQVRLPSFGFKDEETRAANAVRTIRIDFGTITKVRWEYDRRSNSYLRFQSGSAHTDRATGRQLAARNLVLMHVTQEVLPFAEDVAGSQALQHNLLGTGKATIFLDGKRINGKWTSSKKRPPIFTDASGKKVLLNRGQIWIEVVAPRNTVQIG